MPDKVASVVWIDANGRTRQTIIRTLAGAAAIVGAAEAASNAVQQDLWESFAAGGIGVPVAATYQAVADAADMLYQTASGSVLRLTVPAAQLGIFKADKVTVDPTNPLVTALNAAVIGSLSDGAGNPAAVYLGGRYLRGSRTDLDTP